MNHKYHFYSSNEDYFYSNCFIDFQFQDYRFLYLCMVQKLVDYERNIKNIYQLLYNTLDDIPIEEEKKVSLIQRIDLEFFTCKDIQTITDFGGGTDELSS